MTLQRRLNRLGPNMARGPKRPKVSRIDVIDVFANRKEAGGTPSEKKVLTLVWQCGSWVTISSDGRGEA